MNNIKLHSSFSRFSQVIYLGLVVCSTVICGCGSLSNIAKGQPQPLPFQENLVKALKAKYSKPDAIPTTAVTAEVRNGILADMIYLADVNFNKFKATLYAGRAVFDTTNDLSILGLGAAGALTPAAATKAILAAVSGGLAGAHVSINKNFFQEQATTALIAKMEASRKKILALMRTEMKLDISAYSLSQGLSDIGEYYDAGTILGALEDITVTAGADKTAAQEKITNNIMATFQPDEATKSLSDFANDPANAEKLKQWMKDNGVKVHLTTFLNGGQFATQRAKAVQDLINKSNP
jgi:hypothetical protein